MKEYLIKKNEFKKRLENLYVRSGVLKLPRKPRDRHILLKSIALILDKNREYTQPEINAAIGSWLSYAVCETNIDHVWLRRQLVDAGYISRDRSGKSYRLSSDYTDMITFEPSIEQIDPFKVIKNANDKITQRKGAYLKKCKKV